MKKRKIPLRLCLGCGEKRDKRELVRIVRTPEGEVILDETGKKAGRGAYVCRNMHCLMMAVKSKKLEKNLQKPILEETLKNIKEMLTDGRK